MKLLLIILSCCVSQNFETTSFIKCSDDGMTNEMYVLTADSNFFYSKSREQWSGKLKYDGTWTKGDSILFINESKYSVDSISYLTFLIPTEVLDTWPNLKNQIQRTYSADPSIKLFQDRIKTIRKIEFELSLDIVCETGVLIENHSKWDPSWDRYLKY